MWFPKGMACKNHFSKMVSQDLPKGVAGKKHFLKVVAQGLGLQKPLSESGFPGFPRDIACKNHFSIVVSQEPPKGIRFSNSREFFQTL